jgi:tetratricopeptide (TPR) repeat protein
VKRGALRGDRWAAASPAAWAAVALLVGCSPRINESEERGDRYSARGEYVDARVEYQLALDQAGGEAPAGLRMKAAVLALRAKDFTDANRLVEELLEDESDYADRVTALYYLYAQRWAAVGDTFAALRAIEWLQLRDSTASLGSLYYILGDAAYARPDYDQAIASYLMGLARVPEEATPVVYYRLGEAHERGRNCAAAVEYFQRYLAKAAEEAAEAAEAGEVRYRLGSCAFRLAERAFANDDFRRAQAYLELMIRTGEPVSRLADADLVLARIQERLGDRDKAMEFYGRVLERSRDRSSRTAVEAYRRSKQLEFGLPLETVEWLAEKAMRDSLRQSRRGSR